MIERVLSTHIYHPRGEHQGSLLGRHLENPDFGPRQEPGGRRRPLNSNQEPIPDPHQLVGGGKRRCRIRAHQVGHVQAGVNCGPFGTGQKGDRGQSQGEGGDPPVRQHALPAHGMPDQGGGEPPMLAGR